MLFHLHEYKDVFPPLNVLRYVSFRVVAATMTALAMSWLMYPGFIDRLRKLQLGQVVRDNVQVDHSAKQGTPTMGGSLILLCVVLPTLLWTDLSNRFIWIITTVTVTYGIVGFVDDYRKIREKGSRGLPGRWKLFWQFLVGIGVMFVLFDSGTEYNSTLYFPFVSVDRFSLELPVWLYAGLAMVVIVGTSNGVNLTDGLDGLAIGPTIVAAGTFLVLCYIAGTVLYLPAQAESGETVMAMVDFAAYLKIPHVPGVAELAVYCGALIGAGVGFLWFNTYPASVFMGDVGALSLGGGLGTLAVLSKNEFLSVIIFGIFFVETLSVITQTTSYKLTGKRVFRMAPYHHHLELKGWAEPKIIVRFWIISILLALVALASLKLR